MKKRICLMLVLLCMLLQASAALAGSKECARAEDHRFGPWQTKKTATCTRQGHQFRYCNKCIHWEQRWTAKLPHTPDQWVVSEEPTCVRKGKETATCTVCNNEIHRAIDMLEHEYGEMTVVKEPTCTQDGRGEYVCAGCGKKKSETIEKLGHDWGEVVASKEATCTKAGKGTRTCQRCGRESSVEIEKLPHAWNWTVTREPEGKRKGERTGVCASCGGERKEYFYPEGSLYLDMEPSAEVIRLQEKLKDLGYYNGSISSGAVGKYGQLTAEAVERFQKAKGLKRTGIADPATLEAINAAWEKKTGKTDAETLDAQEMENAAEAKQAGA